MGSFVVYFQDQKEKATSYPQNKTYYLADELLVNKPLLVFLW